MELKKKLNEPKIMDTAFNQYRDILARELRGPGDLEAAMWRLQAKRGLDYWRQWMLKYKRAAGSEFREQIRQAYLDTLAASVRRDLEALKTERAKGASDADMESLIVEAQTLLEKIQAKRVAA